MTDDWRRVGENIERRITALGLTKAEVCRRSDVSDVTLNSYINGSPIKRLDKAAGLAAALQWTTRSFELIAAGGEPEEVDAPVEVRSIREEIAELRERFDRFEQFLRAMLDRAT